MSKCYPRIQLLGSRWKYDAISRCCRMVSSCCWRTEVLTMGVLCKMNSWSCCVGFCNSSVSGMEKMALLVSRILSEKEYRPRTLASSRSQISLFWEVLCSWELRSCQRRITALNNSDTILVHIWSPVFRVGCAWCWLWDHAGEMTP